MQFGIKISDGSIEQIMRAVRGVETKAGRDALRAGMSKATRAVTKQLKGQYPVGRTGKLKASIHGKTKFRLKDGYAVGLIGQRTDKVRRPDKGSKISEGIPGNSGTAAPIHLVDNPVKAHKIAPRRSKVMLWNRGKGGEVYNPPRRSRSAVFHGGTTGKRKIPKVDKQTRRMRVQVMRRAMIASLEKLRV